MKETLSACGKDIKRGQSGNKLFQDTVNGLHSFSALVLLCSENETLMTWVPKSIEEFITCHEAELQPIGDVGKVGGLCSQTTLEMALYNAIHVWVHYLPRQTSFKMTKLHVRKLLAKMTEAKFESCRIPAILDMIVWSHPSKKVATDLLNSSLPPISDAQRQATFRLLKLALTVWNEDKLHILIEPIVSKKLFMKNKAWLSGQLLIRPYPISSGGTKCTSTRESTSPYLTPQPLAHLLDKVADVKREARTLYLTIEALVEPEVARTMLTHPIGMSHSEYKSILEGIDTARR